MDNTLIDWKKEFTLIEWKKELMKNKEKYFVGHIKNHLGGNGIVICTICKKTIEECADEYIDNLVGNNINH